MNAAAHEPGRLAGVRQAGADWIDVSAEAVRQSCLLGALVDARGPDADALGVDLGHSGETDAGLRAYRGNAHASAERALALACPTLRALIGGDDFAHLGREFWHAHPPQRGDLGVWGDALPAWIDAHAGLAAWPYLADCARLDLALHHCERAADAVLDTASLALLSKRQPDELRLRLRPGVQSIESRWPIVTLHAAHQTGADASLFERAGVLIESGEGEAAVVARDGIRAVVHRIGAPGAAFMHANAHDASLSRALTAAGDDFDFSAWLADALRCHWLLRVERCDG